MQLGIVAVEGCQRVFNDPGHLFSQIVGQAQHRRRGVGQLNDGTSGGCVEPQVGVSDQNTLQCGSIALRNGWLEQAQ